MRVIGNVGNLVRLNTWLKIKDIPGLGKITFKEIREEVMKSTGIIMIDEKLLDEKYNESIVRKVKEDIKNKDNRK